MHLSVLNIKKGLILLLMYTYIVHCRSLRGHMTIASSFSICCASYIIVISCTVVLLCGVSPPPLTIYVLWPFQQLDHELLQ